MRAAAEEVRVQYLARQSEYSAAWQSAAGEVFSVAHVTPDELEYHTLPDQRWGSQQERHRETEDEADEEDVADGPGVA